MLNITQRDLISFLRRVKHNNNLQGDLPEDDYADISHVVLRKGDRNVVLNKTLVSNRVIVRFYVRGHVDERFEIILQKPLPLSFKIDMITHVTAGCDLPADVTFKDVKYVDF